MPFGLQSTFPDGAFLNTLRSIIIHKAYELEMLLKGIQDISDGIQSNKDVSVQDMA